jgi:hypothetical protein
MAGIHPLAEGLRVGPRTLTQLGLLTIGLIVWVYGLRADDPTLRWIGIGFFAVATALRFAKRWTGRPPDS